MELVGHAITYIVTLFGAIAMYAFSLQRGFKGAIAFLERMFPGRSSVFYDRLDFLIVSFAGSVIGYIFYSPATYPQALAAGLGWVSAVNVVMNKASK